MRSFKTSDSPHVNSSLEMLEPSMQELGTLADFSNPDIGKAARRVLNEWRMKLMQVARRELRKGGQLET